MVDFDSQFGNGAGGGCLIDDPFFGVFDLGVGCIVEVVEVVQREDRQAFVDFNADFCAALEKLFLAQSLFQAFAAAAQRLVNRFRRRGQPALQDGQGEADRSLCGLRFRALRPG